ncbi:CPBP family intramembrane glutamic endopeptidase [Bacillus mojavensis]|uniref:CPBP family intramembrane glutamic endopeptidase n=1 Tax=Bacillus mojavensis TaxID=72360 RepID=UPI00256F20B8|nr:type II CAAX endopeptidase family protein [Bacillus mojavensis]
MNSFIRPLEGNNTLWRYFFSFLVMVGLFFFGSIVYVFMMLLTALLSPNIAFDVDTGMLTDSLADLFLTHIVYVFAIPGVWLAVRFILKRPFRSVITPHAKISWRSIFFGFIAYFLLMAVVQGIDYAIHPAKYTFQDFDASRFLWLLVASLLLVPLQTSAEELFFRGFLLQAFGKVIKNPFVLTLIVGGLFGAVHFGNPEMNNGAFWAGIEYVTIGILLTYYTVKTGSLEISLGVHAANNMFLCLFITEKNSVYGDIPSLFAITRGNPMWETFFTVVINLLFAFIVVQYHKRSKRKQQGV